MALTINSGAQLVFFTHVFGDGHPVTEHAKILAASGMTFEVGLYNVMAVKDGKKDSISLTTGTTALMKGTVDAPILAQNKKLLEGWVAGLGPVAVQQTTVNKVWVSLGSVKPNLIFLIKAIRTVTGLSLAEAKAIADKVMLGQVMPITLSGFMSASSAVAVVEQTKVNVSSVPPVPVPGNGVGLPPSTKPVDKVIDLKSAQVLGQKVHGTSNGSVYYTIALSEHVKIAARLYKHGGISIRAEWTDNPHAELQKLSESGVQMKQGYGSLHFDAQQVPMERVIGAFLMGTGIKWKAAVTGAELVIAES